MLWAQEYQTCQPIVETCWGGYRLLSVTVELTSDYLAAIEAGWIGFTDDATNRFYTSGYDSAALTVRLVSSPT